MDIKDAMRGLKLSTRALTRHFISNPAASTKFKYLKVQKQSSVLHFEHRLHECKSLIYDRLKTTVEEENARQDQLTVIMAKEQKTSGEVSILTEELEKAKKERMGEINKKNDIIRKLKGIHQLS